MILDGNSIGRRSSNQSTQTNNIQLGIQNLNILCRYVLQDSHFIRMEHLVHLKRLLYFTDRATYENDPDQLRRVDFLIKALEARLDYNLTDRELILAHINGGLTFKIDFIDYDNIDMSKNDIEWCHRLVENLLDYAFFFNEAPNLQELLTRFNSTDISKRIPIIKEAEVVIDRIKNNFRKAHVESNLNDVTFSLEDGTFESAVTDTYNMVTNPSRRLYTGMQGFNQMIGGGFESGRVYMLLGIAGVGKSLTILNLINQMKKYNTMVKAKDPSKRPCIVLLTMENTVVETITRLFDMVTEDNHGMGNYDVNEVIYKMRTEGGLSITESSPLDIVIIYKANRSISTSYLYTLYDDLSDQGKEPVCVVQDHVKRIRSADYNPDLRLELGDIVNELKVFAADKDIPVITVSHLNREASRIVEEAANKGKADSGKLLGKSNIGESLLMVDNLDCGITISRDYDKDGLCYMTFHRIKMRDKGSTIDYIAQPFLIDNPIRLVEDVGSIPQYKETLHTAPIMNMGNNMRMSGGTSNMINMIDKNDLSDNVFSNNKASYNLSDEPISTNSDEFLIAAEEFDDDISDLLKGMNLSVEDKSISAPRKPISFEDKPFTIEISPYEFN